MPGGQVPAMDLDERHGHGHGEEERCPARRETDHEQDCAERLRHNGRYRERRRNPQFIVEHRQRSVEFLQLSQTVDKENGNSQPNAEQQQRNIGRTGHERERQQAFQFWIHNSGQLRPPDIQRFQPYFVSPFCRSYDTIRLASNLDPL